MMKSLKFNINYAYTPISYFSTFFKKNTNLWKIIKSIMHFSFSSYLGISDMNYGSYKDIK